MPTVSTHVTARWLALLMLVLMATAGCAVKFVADYDQGTFDEILKVGKGVDLFYGNLLEVPEADRKYAKFSSAWVQGETDIRSLLMRNQARPLNSESVQINQTILNLWLKYKGNHQSTDGYKTGVARLDRNRFLRLFAAAADAEAAKRLSSGDRDVSQDSK